MAEDFYEKLLESLYDGVYFVGLDRRITYWNAGAERLTGYLRGEVMGKRCSDNILCHVDAAGTNLCVDGCPLAATMHDGRPRECEPYFKHKDGHRVPSSVRAAPIRDDGDRIIGAVEIFSSNLKAARLAELVQQLQNEALQDSLTHLGNRRFAEVSIETQIRAFERHQIPFGILFVDLDHFKAVNDEHGHNAGDAVLTMVGRTILSAIRPLDLPCRWGGEEFIVILPNVDHASLRVAAERLRMLVQSCWVDHETGRLRITASIGGAIVKSGETPETLIERADRQLYRSKESGRNQVHIESPPA